MEYGGKGMQGFNSFVRRFSKAISGFGGVILILMMLLTVVDVVLRYLGKGFTGAFELMSFGGALVVGFALSQSSLDNAHVTVDIISQSLGQRSGRILFIITRLMGIAFFLLLAWSCFLKGNELYTGGEVSLTLRVPFYPVAYALALCSIAECLALLTGIFTTETTETPSGVES
jgi:TRAP-type C4-dicarboxylate transport system permease small subunit